jgi:hypothetical protein
MMLACWQSMCISNGDGMCFPVINFKVLSKEVTGYGMHKNVIFSSFDENYVPSIAPTVLSGFVHEPRFSRHSFIVGYCTKHYNALFMIGMNLFISL